MTVERFDVRSVTPYTAPVPGFEQVTAVATVALDPTRASNAFVVDLDGARRDHDGLVRLETDVVVVRGKGAAGAPTGGAGPLLVVIANRGLVAGLPFSAGVPIGAVPDGTIHPGDAWVLRHGMSVAWIGWQWDVERRPGVVGIDVPEVVDRAGQPVRSQARLEFLPLTAQPHRRLADEVGPWMGQFQSLTAADVDEPEAALTVRDWFNGPRQTIDRARWRFAREVDGAPVADAEYIWLEGGFEGRRYYEVTYTTGRAPVAGAGLAAMRDVVSFLRNSTGFSRVLTTGSSQSGRWLRQFLYDSANTDEDGAAVFDGVFCHIAGGRRGEFNNRSAQPSTMNALGFAHLPPFSPEDGLLAPARERGHAPLTLFVNSATEYWRGDASLVHTGPGGTDLPDGPDWRAYLYGGVHHAAGLPPEFAALYPLQFGPNRVEALWATRAHMAALDAWVANGTLPPPSEVPRSGDRSGRSRAEVLAWFAASPRFPGVVWPDPEALLGMPPIDLGPGAARGVGRYPAEVTGPARPCLVAAVDDDGNEACGVRMPEVAVPLGVSLGWNPEMPRADRTSPGGRYPVEVWNLMGGGFTWDPAEIRARYGDREGYLRRVAACVADLVARRHLLAEDAPHVVKHAAALWDEAVPG